MPAGRLAAAAFGLTWLVLLATSPGIPMVWDEGEYLGRAQHVIEWLRLRPLDFSSETIRKYWLFIFYAEGHPAGFAIPIVLGKWIASAWLDPLIASRLGPITLFSAACAAVAVRLKKDHGTVAAIAGPALLLTFPRIFSEAHFATQDGQLTAWWLILWAWQSEFSLAGNLRTSVGLGTVLGLLTATKFTGWLAWVPFMLSEAIKGWGAARARVRLRVVVPVALVVFWIVNPPLWHHPIDGLLEYFRRNLDRGNTINISMLFLGGLYNLDRPLPWYNTVVWLVFVTPISTLALGLLGVWQCVARRTLVSIGLLLHWMTLMIVRALPGTPPHDGIRLILPAFGFWCVIAAIGAQWIVGVTTTKWRRLALRTAFAGVLIANAVSIFRYYPQTLSHYSVLVGGVRGAADKGMEPAYWWDALDKDVLAWLNEHTAQSESIAFSTISHVAYLRETRKLRREVVDPEKAPFKWYVLQNRPGIFSVTDRFLMRDEKPAYAKYAGRRSAEEEVPGDLDVPLISVFSYEQYQRVRHR